MVGTLTANDPDVGDSHTFQFGNGTSVFGAFEIVGNELRVRNGVAVDFEQASIIALDIRARDGSGAVSPAGSTNISVNDINPENVTGMATSETIVGGALNDILSAGVGGDDVLDGRAGDDTFFATNGADTITGGANTAFGDTLSFVAWASAVDINLSILTPQAWSGGTLDIVGCRKHHWRRGDDTLRGTTGNNRLEGGAGVDRLEGGEGDDVLEGGSGVDTYVGGLGNDAYYVRHLGADGRVQDNFTELAGAGH